MNKRYFVRQGAGPILTVNNIPCEANAVLNPGATEVGGNVVLLLRVESKNAMSHIRVASSHNGVDSWEFADQPILEPALPGYPHEEWGCEDPRVTKIASDEWVIAYTAYSRHGATVSLATTSDFDQVNRLGPAFIPTNKDAAVFPKKIGKRYYMLHRPDIGGKEDIYYTSTSQHLVDWTNPGLLMENRGGPYWDSERIGAGCPPIETQYGWLLIYHGTKAMGSKSIYRLGVALLDKADPTKVIARGDDWIFAPEAEYEFKGLMPGVVFTCGALVRGDEIWMYYGAADTCVGLAVGKIDEILKLVT